MPANVIRIRSVTAEIGAYESLPACLDQHLKWCRLRGLAETTIYQRLRAVTRLRAHVGFDLFIAEEPVLLEWRDSLARMTDIGIVCEVSHVKNFYEWALEAGYVSANPATRIPVPKLGRRLPRPISEDDALLALEYAPKRIRPWLVLAGWAGLRAKEIALLRRENVLDTARPPYLLVAANATKGHRERIVPMSDFVLAELLPVLPRSGWVFPREDGQPGPNTPARVSGLCNAHLHDCGIPETLHQFRHRFGTGTYRASLDIRLVQELMGHGSVVTTAGYAAAEQGNAVAAVAALRTPRRLRAAR